MKFLHVRCTHRNEDVFINLDKILLIVKKDEGRSVIELAGETAPVEVDLPAEELVRKINGEDRTGIGFRRGA